MTRQKREIEVIRWKKRQGCKGGRISGWSDGEAEIVRARGKYFRQWVEA